MRKRITVIIALIIMILSLGGVLFYFFYAGEAEREFKEMKENDFDLVALWKKNNDLVGWIKIPGTGIDYPVMMGENYLHKDFNGEYSESGTPFVQDDWTTESKNSLIYGHNMWVQKNMFNPLHKYEDEDYWREHKKGVFYVLMDTPDGGKEVHEREFSLEHIILTSVNEEINWQGYINPLTNMDMEPYLEWCGNEEMHESGLNKPTGYGVVTLCTCSYHIKGNRSAGRLLAVGHIRKVNVPQKY